MILLMKIHLMMMPIDNLQKLVNVKCMKSKLKYKVGDVVRIKSYDELKSLIIENDRYCAEHGYIQAKLSIRLNNLKKRKDTFCDKDIIITNICKVNGVDTYYISKDKKHSFGFYEDEIKELIK